LLAAALCASGGAGDEELRVEPWRAQLRRGDQALRQQQVGPARAEFAAALETARAAGSEEGRLAALDGLATTTAIQGDLAGAESLYVQLLDLQRRRLDADSLAGMALVRTLGSLGEISLGLGELAAAQRSFEQILDLGRTGVVDLRPEEAALGYALHGLAEVARARGDTAGADSLAGRAMGLRLYAQGFDHYTGDDLQQAEGVWRRALAEQERVLGPAHIDVARTAHALGRLYAFQRRMDEAVLHHRRAVRAYELSGADPSEHAAALTDLAADLEAAEPAAADSLRLRAAALRRHPRGTP
jgi:serine/threonine-protein kinase